MNATEFRKFMFEQMQSLSTAETGDVAYRAHAIAALAAPIIDSVRAEMVALHNGDAAQISFFNEGEST